MKRLALSILLVKFRAEEVKGDYVVTMIEKAK